MNTSRMVLTCFLASCKSWSEIYLVHLCGALGFLPACQTDFVALFFMPFSCWFLLTQPEISPHSAETVPFHKISTPGGILRSVFDTREKLGCCSDNSFDKWSHAVLLSFYNQATLLMLHHALYSVCSWCRIKFLFD